MNKKRLLLFLWCLSAAFSALADEGMWLPSLIGRQVDDMKAKGFRLTAEDIYSVNQASLKDAVVLFGRGCTGELVSPEGLLLTNHHCGYGQIQSHSSLQHDYLTDGFWAMSREEELPNPGLTVSFLVRMEDVTDRVLAGVKDDMDETRRQKKIAANIERVKERALKEYKGQKGYEVSVESLYYGNQYFLFLFRTYGDVRLVGSAAIRTTGCGPVIRAISPCSASMRMPTTSRRTTLWTTFPTVPGTGFRFPRREWTRAISHSFTAVPVRRANT